MKISLLSDTHSCFDEKIKKYLLGADEIWHAGDIGSLEVLGKMREIAPVRAVYGNIDGKEIRWECPEDLVFELEGLKVFMTHIGGFTPGYAKGIKEKLALHRPRLFICGHSHILRAMPDKERSLIHLNPGAAGVSGFHKIRTLLRFEIENGKILKLEAVELGLRGGEGGSPAFSA